MMKRVIVKMGSQLLCEDNGNLDFQVLDRLVGQMAGLRRDGWQLVLVSSGAVAAGIGLARPDAVSSDPVTRKQVLAATGQVRLMQTYQVHFGKHGFDIAQVLTCKSDFQTRNHYLNMRNCIEGILDAGIVPIVNENDVVSVTELMFTDNDELAGLLAGMVNADLLCLLSTVDGVYDSASQAGESAIIGSWDDELHSIDEVVDSGTSKFGRGGMHSKISSARKTAALGTEVVIANGREENVLSRITVDRSVGTTFPAGHGTSPAKRWLASADDHAVGIVRVNEGAAQALLDQSRLASLLPVGINALEGEFKRGDVIRIIGPKGAVLGCGRAQYDREEAQALLGQQGHKPLIHYDYLYLSE